MSTSNIDRPPPGLKSGSESFQESGDSAGFTVIDYWQWSGSDLLSNTQRGVVAEFLVAKALEVTMSPRLEWGWYDLKTRGGIKVEVKSASYYQSWPQERASAIQFDIAPRKSFWDPKTNESNEFSEPTRLSDVYVFCLLGCPEQPNPNPLDLDQWTFFVIDTGSLNREVPLQKTIRLSPLKTLLRETKGREVKYPNLSVEITKLAKPRKS